MVFAPPTIRTGTSPVGRPSSSLDPLRAADHVEAADVDLAQVGLDAVDAADRLEAPGDRRVQPDRRDALAPVERDAAVLDEHPAVADPDLRGRAVEAGPVELRGRAARPQPQFLGP